MLLNDYSYNETEILKIQNKIQNAFKSGDWYKNYSHVTIGIANGWILLSDGCSKCCKYDQKLGLPSLLASQLG